MGEYLSRLCSNANHHQQLNTQLQIHLHVDRQTDRKVYISIGQWESNENEEAQKFSVLLMHFCVKMNRNVLKATEQCNKRLFVFKIYSVQKTQIK